MDKKIKMSNLSKYLEKAEGEVVKNIIGRREKLGLPEELNSYVDIVRFASAVSEWDLGGAEFDVLREVGGANIGSHYPFSAATHGMQTNFAKDNIVSLEKSNFAKNFKAKFSDDYLGVYLAGSSASGSVDLLEGTVEAMPYCGVEFNFKNPDNLVLRYKESTPDTDLDISGSPRLFAELKNNSGAAKDLLTSLKNEFFKHLKKPEDLNLIVHNRFAFAKKVLESEVEFDDQGNLIEYKGWPFGIWNWLKVMKHGIRLNAVNARVGMDNSVSSELMEKIKKDAELQKFLKQHLIELSIRLFIERFIKIGKKPEFTTSEKQYLIEVSKNPLTNNSIKLFIEMILSKTFNPKLVILTKKMLPLMFHNGDAYKSYPPGFSHFVSGESQHLSK